MTCPRVYVEAAERFAQDAGMHAIRRYVNRDSLDYTALLVAENCDVPALVCPVTAGTISLTDALRILRGAK